MFIVHVHVLVNPLTGGGGLSVPYFWKACSGKKVMKSKKLGKISYSTEIMLALNSSSFVSLQKSHLLQVIHGYLGQTQKLGPEYSWSEVRYLQNSSVESTLSHCRRCYSPPPPGGGGGGWRLRGSKTEQQKCRVFVWPPGSQTSKHFLPLTEDVTFCMKTKNVNKM
jgi:hypothetical protein